MSSLESGLEPASFEDDLETELLPLRRRRRLPIVTAILALCVVAGGAFVGGVEIQKHYGGTSGTSGGGASAASLASSARATGRSFGLGGSATRTGAAGGVTAGEVSVIKGSTLYVTDTSGNTVKVTTTGATVTKSVTTSVTSINPGDTVVVRGTQAKDGTYKASAITLGGAGLAGGLGGGFGGGGFQSGGSSAGGFGGGSTSGNNG